MVSTDGHGPSRRTTNNQQARNPFQFSSRCSAQCSRCIMPHACLQKASKCLITLHTDTDSNNLDSVKHRLKRRRSSNRNQSVAFIAMDRDVTAWKTSRRDPGGARISDFQSPGILAGFSLKAEWLRISPQKLIYSGSGEIPTPLMRKGSFKTAQGIQDQNGRVGAPP